MKPLKILGSLALSHPLAAGCSFVMVACASSFAVATLILTAASCGVPAAEIAGHTRNATIGVEHALALDECILKAKASDAGSRYVFYEDCAAIADQKYGRKP